MIEFKEDITNTFADSFLWTYLYEKICHPELDSGWRWVWHGAVSLKAPLTFRHAEHQPLLSCWIYFSISSGYSMVLYRQKTLNQVQGDGGVVRVPYRSKTLSLSVMLNTTPTVMLNLVQHLIELWQSSKYGTGFCDKFIKTNREKIFLKSLKKTIKKTVWNFSKQRK